MIFRSLLSLAFVLVLGGSFVSAETPHESWLDFVAGNWNFAIADRAGNVNLKGSVAFTRTGDTPAFTINAKGQNFSLLAVSGWYADEKRFVETGFVGKERYVRTFNEVDENALVGTHTGMDRQGNRVSHEVRYAKTGANSMKLTGDDYVVTFERENRGK